MNGRRSLNPRVFWPMAAIGTTIMGIGIFGLLEDSHRTQPAQWVRWFVGAAIAHDFVLAPTVAAVGVLVAHRTRPLYRAIAQGVLIVSGIVFLTAYPFLRGYGRRPDNPSVLPNDYWIGLLLVLAVIGVVAACLALRSHRRGLPRTERLKRNG